MRHVSSTGLQWPDSVKKHVFWYTATDVNSTYKDTYSTKVHSWALTNHCKLGKLPWSLRKNNFSPPISS